uniref:Uncharacterized protein n=1 Tax=Curvibacter symbiont subsp. Hydra magnipapillata TaxID=667019 RepID=C9YBS0_CURXX|nr:hypothetical protein Csp_A00160 [Curvibacter putative symbiont of Hydra magnipapillata]
MTLDELLLRWIPYRLQAIETLLFAWKWLDEGGHPRSVQVVENGRVRLNCNAAAVANPMIEAGLIHARALLEFMGLCASGGKLSQIQTRRKDDVAIEHFSSVKGPLGKVEPSAAIATYAGPPDEAEKALLSIFEFANKGMAHLTTQATISQYTDAHLEIACRGIPVLLQNNLYTRLGMPVPPPPEAKP